MAVNCDSDQNFQEAFVKKNIREIIAYTQGAKLALIDIPIGLKDKNQPGKRVCDIAARKKLGKNGLLFFQSRSEKVWDTRSMKMQNIKTGRSAEWG